MKKFLLLSSLIPIFQLESLAQDVKAFYIGHSLSDGIIDMVNSLSSHHDSVNFEFRYQTIPGSPLRWNWQAKDRNDYNTNNPYYCGFYNDTFGLPAGDFDVLVLTESVPRFTSIINESYEYADSFYRFATAQNPNTKIYIYEVWHCIKSGTPTECDYDIDANPWRQRLDDDLPMWESVVDTLNNRFNPTNPVCLIPAGQGLAALYDSIQANAIPGITSINQLFSDDIHINDIAKYFVACIHFSMLHGKSPVGLTNQLSNMWGGNYTEIPTAAQALKFQEIAWYIANNYAKSCLDTNEEEPPNNIEIISNNEFKIFPNPANTIIYFEDKIEYKIVNSLGRTIMKSKDNKAEIAHLRPGIYIIFSDKGTYKFIKE